MRTLGIDFAAQPKNTALYVIEWGRDTAEITKLACGVGDEQICEAIAGADKAGLDVPLGCPISFPNAIRTHSEHRPWPKASIRELRFRATDLFVQAKTRQWPLSVSTDRIGVAP